jgi:elongation factor G
VHHFESDKIRNVVLLSHSGAGKTSLAEAMLFDAGAITRLGIVNDGTTTSDFEPDEIKRHISISLSVLPCQWKDTKFNIIDTPGYPDFVGEVKAGLAVSEGAVIVVCASSGVEVGTQQVWDYVDEAKLPALILMNKMDRENANFSRTLGDIQNKIGNKCLPIQLPIGAQKSFQGVVDIITRKAYIGTPSKEAEVPAAMQDEIDLHREKLIEAIVEVDDELLSKYLDGAEIAQDDIYRCLKQAILLGKVVPVLPGCALSNIAVTSLMDAIHDYLPSPIDKGTVVATNATSGAEEKIEPVSGSPLAAMVFKTSSDPRAGRLSYLRVYSGTVSSNSQAWNVIKNVVERIGQLFVIRGKTQEAVDKLTAGDIGVVAKLASTTTGDMLGVKEHLLKLTPIKFPEPILNKAILPKSRADLDKMGSALSKLCEEDLTLRVHRDPDVGEILLGGMGETHLEVAAEKLNGKFGVEVMLELPKVPYKETISTSTQAEYKHKKQTGGHGQYGHVLLELEPLPRGTGFEFMEKVVGGAVPRNYIPAVEKGVNEGRLEGVLAGYPLVDVRVTLFDGSSHPVDSSEMAFKIAAAQALKKGLEQAQPVLLEPIVSLTVTAPDNFIGDIIGDLNSKRARVMGMNPSGGLNTIEAQVPLSEVLRYATDLRSLTQGRGIFKTTFSHYEEVPAPIAQKITAQKKASQ